MSLALYLLATLGCLGVFDTLYYHEWHAKLPPLDRAAHSELQLHAWRDLSLRNSVCDAALNCLAGAMGRGIGRAPADRSRADALGFRCRGLDPQGGWRTLRRRANHARHHGNYLWRDAGEAVSHALGLAVRAHCAGQVVACNSRSVAIGNAADGGGSVSFRCARFLRTLWTAGQRVALDALALNPET